MRLLYEYEKRKNGIVIRLETGGSLLELASATGRLIQELHDKLPAEARPIFRKAICLLVSDDDTPIWSTPGEPSVRIDLAEPKKQAGALHDES